MSNFIRDGLENAKAAKELRAIARALARDAESWFELGLFRTRKVLTNGYTIRIEIKQGARPKPRANRAARKRVKP